MIFCHHTDPHKLKDETFESIANANRNDWFYVNGSDYAVFQNLAYIDNANHPGKIVANVRLYSKGIFDRNHLGWRGVDRGDFFVAINYMNMMTCEKSMDDAMARLSMAEQRWSQTHQNETIQTISNEYAATDRQKCISYCDDANRIGAMIELRKDREILGRKISRIMTCIAAKNGNSK